MRRHWTALPMTTRSPRCGPTSTADLTGPRNRAGPAGRVGGLSTLRARCSAVADRQLGGDVGGLSREADGSQVGCELVDVDGAAQSRGVRLGLRGRVGTRGCDGEARHRQNGGSCKRPVVHGRCGHSGTSCGGRRIRFPVTSESRDKKPGPNPATAPLLPPSCLRWRATLTSPGTCAPLGRWEPQRVSSACRPRSRRCAQPWWSCARPGSGTPDAR
jgi:hypothetical protein